MKRLLLVLMVVIGLVIAGGTLAAGTAAPHAVQRPLAGQPSAFSRSTPTAVRAHRRVMVVAAAVRTTKRTDHIGARTTIVAARPASGKQGLPGQVAHTGVTVTGRYLLVDPSAAAAGATLSVRGGGFAPGALLHLTLSAPGQTPWPVASVTAGPDGLFQTTLTMPTTTTAPASRLVIQDSGGRSAAATVLLHAAQPLAGIAPNVVTPGQRVALWVANMRPGETVRVYAGRTASQPILTVTAGGDGRGSWPLAVPFGPGGPNQLIVIGELGRAPVVAPYLLLNLYPHASVSSYAPQPGAAITFYGGGFAPHERVELHLDRPLGSFSAPFSWGAE